MFERRLHRGARREGRLDVGGGGALRDLPRRGVANLAVVPQRPKHRQIHLPGTSLGEEEGWSLGVFQSTSYLWVK